MDVNYAFICALFVMLTISVYAQDDDSSYGRRSRPTPNRTKPCRWGSEGICGGIMNEKCATGTTCQQVWPTATAGVCCRNKPETRRCKYGRPRGSCGVVGGSQRCLPGYTCQYFSGSVFGTCCKTKPVEDDCNHGTCGTILGLTCRPGTTCRLSGNYPDAGGKCCINKPPTGGCPKASGMPGLCVFDTTLNCLGDEFCGRGQLCCREGCGRVCKDPVYVPTDILL